MVQIEWSLRTNCNKIKIRPKRYKTKLLYDEIFSHTHLESKNIERGSGRRRRSGRRERKPRKVWNIMGLYGLKGFCMDFWTFIWILVVPFLGFS